MLCLVRFSSRCLLCHDHVKLALPGGARVRRELCRESGSLSPVGKTKETSFGILMESELAFCQEAIMLDEYFLQRLNRRTVSG